MTKFKTIRRITKICLDCGCGDQSNNHGNPLHLTKGRFKLIASINKRSQYDTVLIILATLLGLITKTNPLDESKGDKIVGAAKRGIVKVEKEARYK